MKLLEDARKHGTGEDGLALMSYTYSDGKRHFYFMPEPVIDQILKWRDEAYGKKSEIKFSYDAFLYAEAYRQLGKKLPSNLLTIMVAIQKDIDAAKEDILHPKISAYAAQPSEQQEWQGDAGDKLNEVLKQKGIDPATLKPSEQQETSAAKTFENLQKLLKWLDQRLTALENHETLMPLFKAIVDDIKYILREDSDAVEQLSKLGGGK